MARAWPGPGPMSGPGQGRGPGQGQGQNARMARPRAWPGGGQSPRARAKGEPGGSQSLRPRAQSVPSQNPADRAPKARRQTQKKQTICVFLHECPKCQFSVFLCLRFRFLCFSGKSCRGVFWAFFCFFCVFLCFFVFGRASPKSVFW